MRRDGATSLFLSRQRTEALGKLRQELSDCSDQLKSKLLPEHDETRNVYAICRALLPKAIDGDNNARLLMRLFSQSIPNHTSCNRNWRELDNALKAHNPVQTELILMEAADFFIGGQTLHRDKLWKALEQVDNVTTELRLGDGSPSSLDDAWTVVEALVLSKPRWTDPRYGYSQYHTLIRRAMFEGRESVVRALVGRDVGWYGEKGAYTPTIQNAPHAVAQELLNQAAQPNSAWAQAVQRGSANSVARGMLYVILSEFITKDEMNKLVNMEKPPTTKELIALIPKEALQTYKLIFTALIKGGATELDQALKPRTESTDNEGL